MAFPNEIKNKTKKGRGCCISDKSPFVAVQCAVRRQAIDWGLIRSETPFVGVSVACNAFASDSSCRTITSGNGVRAPRNAWPPRPSLQKKK
ncbi:hypothetical protein CEXT_314021 [Caerostris extrusa]|uniref:Uncharacterized protein n=1 Tax=Caerostris extrusa TaxID=172846 RepID=A0AAV4PEB5_CAEEX|nr:hypothetical protein CEXT_314021 [Caerostris extrusa]